MDIVNIQIAVGVRPCIIGASSARTAGFNDAGHADTGCAGSTGYGDTQFLPAIIPYQ